MKANQKILLAKNENDDYDDESVEEKSLQGNNLNGIDTKIDNSTFFRYDYNNLKDKAFQSMIKKNFEEKEYNNENEGKNKIIFEMFKKEYFQDDSLFLFKGRLNIPVLEINEEDEKESNNDSEEYSIDQVAEYKHTLNTLKEDLSGLRALLGRKRKYEENNMILLNDYDKFLIKFYSSGNNKNKDELDKSDNSYLYNRLKNYVFGKKIKKNISTGKKQIGLTPADIYKLDKYKIDIKNIPKFSKIFDRIHINEDLTNQNRIYLSLENVDIKSKKKQTLSYIERQNSEALKSIEEKRQKFKNLPKANKEKMDNTNLHKHWNWIVKRDIPKMYKIYVKFKNDIDYNCKRFSTFVQKEVKKKAAKVQRAQKEVNIRARKLQKEMMIFWRKRDKEILEIKKRKDKIEVEKKKKEDELQEAVIQKKRLEYIMKQSDIYSFFMIKNMGMIKGDEKEENQEVVDNNEMKIDDKQISQPVNNIQPTTTVINNSEVQINPRTNKIIFQSIKVEVDENAAKEGVKHMINRNREKVLKFDQQMNRIRTTLGGEEAKISKFEECKDEDLALEGLDNPKINNTSSQIIEAPKSFLGELKEYQLKGLRWLDNLYEQGINGILADEMGLGKTIQAISLLAHLSEEKNNWGPFLVVAPNATLYNWQQEVNRFCPSLKVLPYWGGLKERKTLRKFFNTTNLYTKSAAFHVCITSYQLVVSDAKVFNRVNWQYMILDEAQAIKNINSQRWNILLEFNCRNRLLLTGTPIQNSMSELWALLHFIMPNLFDSHEQFQEWFSKDIEAHSQEKGELNQEQLKRLHKILKPFMLRRVKKDVENEIGQKTEIEILCEMTERQKILYNSIKEKLSNISDLFSSVDSRVKVENLMNLVMQFRKVCNHPELFERNMGKVPFIFRDLIFSRTSTFVNANSVTELRTDKSSGISFILPKLIYDECFNLNSEFIQKYNFFKNTSDIVNSKLFDFVKVFNFSAFEFLNLLKTDTIIAAICLGHYLKQQNIIDNYYINNYIFSSNNISEVEPFGPINKYSTTKSIRTPFNIFINSRLYINNERISFFKKSYDDLNPLIQLSVLDMKANYVNNQFKKHHLYIPKSISLPENIICSSSRINKDLEYGFNNILVNKILYGKNFKQFNNLSDNSKLLQKFKFKSCNQDLYIDEILENGLMTDLFYKYEGYSQIELPSFERLISDCAKLKKLDELLTRLSKENHRVLIFCQMTRMLDILEEYMAKRRYVYFRMDGSTNIADRRDMVNEFQINPNIFAFLLSTRAGGLGVNLTGADTVIFYDNDWNPTMDAQATDRAHRIGQTKKVTVYRLITKDTIEERILKRAKQKQNVQTTVYSGGAFKADIFKQSEIVELLYSEEEVKKMEAERKKLLLEYNNSNNADSNFPNEKKKNKKAKQKSDKKIKKKEDKKEEKDVKNPVKNIFSVSSNKLVNEIKVDSSDDENNIIIQDGDNPIDLQEDEENEEEFE